MLPRNKGRKAQRGRHSVQGVGVRCSFCRVCVFCEDLRTSSILHVCRCHRRCRTASLSHTHVSVVTKTCVGVVFLEGRGRPHACSGTFMSVSRGEQLLRSRLTFSSHLCIQLLFDSSVFCFFDSCVSFVNAARLCGFSLRDTKDVE